MVRSGKRYAKLENWFFQNAVEIDREDRKEHLKKKIKSIEAYEFELWRSKFVRLWNS